MGAVFWPLPAWAFSRSCILHFRCWCCSTDPYLARFIFRVGMPLRNISSRKRRGGGFLTASSEKSVFLLYSPFPRRVGWLDGCWQMGLYFLTSCHLLLSHFAAPLKQNHIKPPPFLPKKAHLGTLSFSMEDIMFWLVDSATFFMPMGPFFHITAGN